MSSLFAGYETAPGYDEAFSADGTVRPRYRRIVGTATPTVDAEVIIARMTPTALSVMADAPRRLSEDQLADHRRRMRQQQQQQ